MNTEATGTRDGESGFSLVETVIAMGILATGLLSLAGVFVLGIGHLAGSSDNLIAREKAREAVESVHTARDTRVITWCGIYNVNSVRHPSCAGTPAGVFLTGFQPLRGSGVDGLVNTADDAAEDLEALPGVGPDNLLGTPDDTSTPLVGFQRQIVISEVLKTNGQPNQLLRQIQVTVSYIVRGATRTYTLTTYISSIS